MNDIAMSEIQRALHTGDGQRATALLDQHEQTLLDRPKFYQWRAEACLRDDNYDGAWLWIWRGLRRYPQDADLNDLMTMDRLHIPLHAMRQRGHEQLGRDFRVLHGTMEIANQMTTMSAALRQRGVESRTLSYYQFYLGYKSDLTWILAHNTADSTSDANLRDLVRELECRFDLFHFHFGTSLTLDRSDLAMLREDGKDMVMHHWGSEVRSLSVARTTNPYAKVKVTDERSIHQRLSSLSAQIAHCIVPDDELYQYVRPYYPHVHVLPPMVDLAVYPPVAPGPVSDKPLIIHAPTHSDIKGTAHVLRSVDALRQRYAFDFQLIQGLSHERAMALYRTAELVIDQLHVGSYGLLAVECMAMGKPVVCWISDFMREKYPGDLPIIVANPDTLTDVLANLLKNRDMWPLIGRQSRWYAEKHHNATTNSAKILDIYASVRGGTTQEG